MTDDPIEKLAEMNERVLLLLGYATAIVMDVKYNRPMQDYKINWFLKAVENVVYLDKPLPPAP